MALSPELSAEVPLIAIGYAALSPELSAAVPLATVGLVENTEKEGNGNGHGRGYGHRHGHERDCSCTRILYSGCQGLLVLIVVAHVILMNITQMAD